MCAACCRGDGGRDACSVGGRNKRAGRRMRSLWRAYECGSRCGDDGLGCGEGERATRQSGGGLQCTGCMPAVKLLREARTRMSGFAGRRCVRVNCMATDINAGDPMGAGIRHCHQRMAPVPLCADLLSVSLLLRLRRLPLL